MPSADLTKELWSNLRLWSNCIWLATYNHVGIYLTTILEIKCRKTHAQHCWLINSSAIESCASRTKITFTKGKSMRRANHTAMYEILRDKLQEWEEREWTKKDALVCTLNRIREPFKTLFEHRVYSYLQGIKLYLTCKPSAPSKDDQMSEIARNTSKNQFRRPRKTLAPPPTEDEQMSLHENWQVGRFSRGKMTG